MTQKEIIQNFGYSQKGAELIIKKLNYYKIGVNTFISEFNNFKNTVTSYGYKEKSVMNMLVQDPRIVTYSGKFEVRYNNMKKILSGKASDAKVITSAIIFLPETLNRKIEMIKSFGFSDEELKIMVAKDPKILGRSKESFDRIFNYFKDLGVTKKNIIKLITVYPRKPFVSFDRIETNLYKLVCYGFTKKEIGKLINNIIDVVMDDAINLDGLFELFRNYGLSNNEIRSEILRYTKIVKYNKEGYTKTINYLKSKDFTDEEIKNVTLKAKEIVRYSKDRLPYMYDVFYKYKVTDANIKHIIIKNPKILYHTTDKIENIFDKLLEYNITTENLIKIVTMFPYIFETNLDTLNEKLRVINKFDLMEGIYYNPKNLIQSAEKTYLRYLYMFNVLEIEPVEIKEINVLFSANPAIKKINEETSKKERYIIPNIEILKKEFSYYKDEEDLIDKFNGRKCMH